MKSANIYKRIMAVIIDHVIITIILLAVYSRILNLDIGQISIDTSTFLLFFTIEFGYFFLLEYYFGKTIGKKIFNLEVKNSNHQNLSLYSAFIRNILRPVDQIGFYLLGFIAIVFTPKSQRIGDIMAKSYVVEKL